MLLFVLLPLGISFVIPSARVAALTSLIGVAVSWLLIARFTYHSPLPLNEPEPWAGLAILSMLAAMGVIIGVFMRRRQEHSLPQSRR